MRLPFRRRRREDEDEGASAGAGAGEPNENLAFAADLWHRLANRDESVWEELSMLDRWLGEVSAEQRTAFGVDVLDLFQNLISHPDSGVDPAAVRARVGPALGRLWDELDAFWRLVADWVDETGVPPTRVPPEAVYSVADSSLANLVRGMHRVLPDGRFVSLADGARRQQATGESFTAT